MSDHRLVYAKRHADGAEWFSLHVLYEPDNKDRMYREIAYQLSDGADDYDGYDLGHAPINEVPKVDPEAENYGDDDTFDVAHVEGSMFRVEVGFEEHNCTYEY